MSSAVQALIEGNPARNSPTGGSGSASLRNCGSPQAVLSSQPVPQGAQDKGDNGSATVLWYLPTLGAGLSDPVRKPNNPNRTWPAWTTGLTEQARR